MTEEGLNASVSLKRGAAARIGLERVALIEAVAELGSISAAAKRLGLSYKGAWDIVQVLNNLFETSLIEAAPGGRSGGAARVTERGVAVAQAFRRMQTEVDAALAKLEAGLAGEAALDMFWSLGVKTSARNALRGEIVRLADEGISCEVALGIASGVEIVAVITHRSVEALALRVGAPAIALIKASFVELVRKDDQTASARNRIAGVVSWREDGPANAEVLLDIGGGKSLVATITLERARNLAIAPGDLLTALIQASHIILAVE